MLDHFRQDYRVRQLWRRLLAPRWSEPPGGDELSVYHRRLYHWWTLRAWHRDHEAGLKLGPVSFAAYRFSFDPRWYLDVCVLGRWGWAVLPLRANRWRSQGPTT